MRHDLRLAQDLGSGKARTRWAVTALRPQTIMNSVCNSILPTRKQTKTRTGEKRSTSVSKESRSATCEGRPSDTGRVFR